MKTATRSILIQLLLAAPFVAGIAIAFHFFPVLQWLSILQRTIADLGPRAAALYPLAYALCNVLLLPGGVLGMASGFFFGLWWGFFLVLAGNVLGAAIAFLISRTIARKWVQKYVHRHPRLAAVDAAIHREGWKIIVLSQLHPLFPTSLLNYLYGITRIRLLPCLLWVMIGQAPGLFVYAYLGTLGQFGINLWRGNSHPHTHEYILWIGGLLVAITATALLGRLSLKILRETGEQAQAIPDPSPEPATLKNFDLPPSGASVPSGSEH